MTLLLDTHTFLWFCQDDPALSAAAKALLEDPANRKLLSLAACWEIAIKAGLGKLVGLTEPSGTYIPNALARTGFELFPIELAHVTAVEALPHHHRDPFDRLLVAQALVEGFPVVSADPAFDPYGVTRLW
ncbi:MAG: PIN domain nuclease [Isosphaera sp.]|nr:PIN domain nuclease [Isosphaera sp.]